MSGANPDPTEPAREPDAVARLQLTQALQRAKYAIAWERAWPVLARLLTVIGLFLVVSWAGLWLALPFIARVIGTGLFVLLALGAMFPILRFRWPTREEGLSRLDRGTGIRHRPATALTDTLASKDPVASPNTQLVVSGSLSGSRLPALEKDTVSGVVPLSGDAAMVASGGALPPLATVYRMRRTCWALMAT